MIIASSDPSRQGTASDHRQLLANLITTGGSTRGTCHSCHEGSGEPDDRPDGVRRRQGRSAGACACASRSRRRSPARTRLRRRCWGSRPVLLGLALLFAYGAAQSLLRPLGILTRAAERIASGEMDPAIPDLGRDEVGRLGRALEHMRAR